MERAPILEFYGSLFESNICDLYPSPLTLSKSLNFSDLFFLIYKLVIIFNLQFYYENLPAYFVV